MCHDGHRLSGFLLPPSSGRQESAQEPLFRVNGSLGIDGLLGVLFRRLAQQRLWGRTLFVPL